VVPAAPSNSGQSSALPDANRPTDGAESRTSSRPAGRGVDGADGGRNDRASGNETNPTSDGGLLPSPLGNVLHPRTPAEIAFSVAAIAIAVGAVAVFTALVTAGMRARRRLQL
jgi:hypothetical protein